MEMHAKALRITNEAQTSAKVGVPNYLEEGQDKSFSSQDDLPPPKVNQSNAGIVKHTKKKRNPSIVKENKVSSN
jgi:hypothetical protein